MEADMKRMRLRAEVFAAASEFNRALGDYYDAVRRQASAEEVGRFAADARRKGEGFVATLDELIAHLEGSEPDDLRADEMGRLRQFRELAAREMDLTR
jgi:hypothetical protein